MKYQKLIERISPNYLHKYNVFYNQGLRIMV